jgi:FlaA1/EpsC-like NDP-sugar epimerase
MTVMAQQGQSEAPLQRLRILILGAGGHAQVVADILQCMGHVDPAVVSIGYLDDNPSLAGRVILDLPVLGALARLPNIEHDAIVVAIGDNLTRGQLYERLRAQGERFALAIHPRATVARDVTIGSGSMLCAGAIVNPGSVVGVN